MSQTAECSIVSISLQLRSTRMAIRAASSTENARRNTLRRRKFEEKPTGAT
ncbi:hypothetical protein PM082_002427 [Marasmius tenuissimus]|nr:hypothetical protein PM082_002427 [Marasmius tenuissimus]